MSYETPFEGGAESAAIDRFSSLSLRDLSNRHRHRRSPNTRIKLSGDLRTSPLDDTSSHHASFKSRDPSCASCQKRKLSCDGNKPMCRTCMSLGLPCEYSPDSMNMASSTIPGQNDSLAGAADQNPPCNTLYVGNLPMATDEDELKKLFSKERGYKRLCYRTKEKTSMCFVEFENGAYATNALTKLHGHYLRNNVKGGLRLSFSKRPLGGRLTRQPTVIPTPLPLQDATNKVQSDRDQSTGVDSMLPRKKSGVVSDLIRDLRRRSTMFADLASDERKRSSELNKAAPGMLSASPTIRSFFYVCTLASYGCTASFTTKDEWMQHTLESHFPGKIWRCSICTEKTPIFHSQLFARAKYDFQSDSPTELNFRKGDLIQILTKKEQWWDGTMAGVRGWLPKTYVTVIDLLTGQDVQTDAQRESDPSDSPVLSSKQQYLDHIQQCHPGKWHLVEWTRPSQEHPSRCLCVFCSQSFEGPESWDQRMQHIAGHFEQAAKSGTPTGAWKSDPFLEEYLLQKDMILRDANGCWQLKDGLQRKCPDKSDKSEKEDSSDSTSLDESSPESSDEYSDDTSEDSTLNCTIDPTISLKSKLFDDLMQGFYLDLKNQEAKASSVAGRTAQNSQTTRASSNSEIHSSRSGKSLGKRAIREDREHSSNDDEEDSAKRRKCNNSADNPDTNRSLRYACPFFKHNSRGHKGRACRYPGFATVHRMKEHMYRTHISIHCNRCHHIFEKEEMLRDHQREIHPCAISNQDPPEGIDASQVARLKSKKKFGLETTEVERWRAIYHFLFPDEDPSLVSPYCDDLIEPLEGNDLSDFEVFSRREFPRRVRQRLDTLWDRLAQPIEDRLRIEFMNIVQSCREELYQEYVGQAGEFASTSSLPPPADPLSDSRSSSSVPVSQDDTHSDRTEATTELDLDLGTDDWLILDEADMANTLNPDHPCKASTPPLGVKERAKTLKEESPDLMMDANPAIHPPSPDFFPLLRNADSFQLENAPLNSGQLPTLEGFDFEEFLGGNDGYGY